MSLFNNKFFTFTKRNLLQLPMGLNCPEMHYFLFNLSPKNHLRSTVFFFIKLLLMHIPCSSTDLGWYNSSPINCMWLIDLLRHLQRPFLFFCFKNHTGLKYFLRVHSAVSNGQFKKKTLCNEWQNEIVMNRGTGTV